MAQQRSVLWHEDTLVWQGQRWQSAPDRVKDHDFATWLPLEFDDGEPPRRASSDVAVALDAGVVKSEHR